MNFERCKWGLISLSWRWAGELVTSSIYGYWHYSASTFHCLVTIHGCGALVMSAAKLSAEQTWDPCLSTMPLKAKGLLCLPDSHFPSHSEEFKSTQYSLLNSFLLDISEVVSVSCTEIWLIFLKASGFFPYGIFVRVYGAYFTEEFSDLFCLAMQTN